MPQWELAHAPAKDGSGKGSTGRAAHGALSRGRTGWLLAGARARQHVQQLLWVGSAVGGYTKAALLRAGLAVEAERLLEAPC